ncbi:MAG: GIY-YIG nuclease family protein [Deltaproteobacteria bacterium]|nr:GIY-YIG nuclease family protein [Deltaproteobacteria bacterium]MBW2399552.1 GIY-YIG nuclease family protein [Deltaproteobacteria bacterium]
MPSVPGTYALLLELPAVSSLRVGRLGPMTFEAPVYLYSGSAFGPGGLAARLTHHLRTSPKPHWHIDYLRSIASVSRVWTTADPRRLECAWSAAARSLRGAREVAGFGASDCRCTSHLVELPRIPRCSTFRRHLHGLVPSCDPISRFSAECRFSVQQSLAADGAPRGSTDPW